MKSRLNILSRKPKINWNAFEIRVSNSIDKNWTTELLGWDKDDRRRK